MEKNIVVEITIEAMSSDYARYFLVGDVADALRKKGIIITEKEIRVLQLKTEK